MTARLASVLVVNYNGRRHTAACLTALERQTLSRHRFEVIVVDNASTDGSREELPAAFPGVTFVPLGTNVGFAEGNNVASRYARGDLLVLLNNDTIPDPFFLEELLRVADANPGMLVAGKLVFAADPTTINSGGLVLLRDGRGADAGFRRPDDGRFESGGPVFGGCGAALAVPASSGPLFDPKYFMYYEDTDLAWREQLAGREAVFAPRAVVLHIHGAAAGEESPLFRFYVERNRALTSLRNGDMFLAVWSGLGLAAKVTQALARLIVRQRPRSHAVAVAKAATAYLLLLPQGLTERHSRRNAVRGG